ncbi:mediator of RNA polymerase II transcription subunit 15a-like isoform X1 [Primulina huaijiensis]|uniref:mediator of RNA polymerase II transcription subunit 15a-like isoform X1 n=4 Tax=Primulina huaijiensis TaxID=1492673 RepID=UPI003CC7456E
MDSNNRGAAEAQLQIPGQSMSSESVVPPGMQAGDWRYQLQADSRQRIVNKIMKTLKRHLPFSGQEGLQELKKIAMSLEEKIYTAATSQSDYLRKISVKMLTMETKSQNPLTNPLQPNTASNSKNPQDRVTKQEMDSNNRGAAEAQLQIPGQSMSSESVVPPGMQAGDWRYQLQADSRQRIVNKIMKTLKRHLPFSGQEGLQELKKIAMSLEEKIYTAATSQSDYLRKISVKMLTMETKSQNPLTNPLQPNTTSNSKNPQDPEMDSNNWRAAQAQLQIPGQSMSSESVVPPGMEAGDWRNQLQADSRQRIVNKIMETLKRHLPFSGPEGLQELKKIAMRFEEKIYTAATSQSDYLRKISLKMLTMETKSQNPMTNPLQPNTASNSKNPQDPASQTMQSQMQNQVQSLPMTMVSNQSQVRQQLLSQNIQNNLTSTGAQLPGGGMSQGTVPNVSSQNPNMQNIQNMSNVTQNVVGNSMGQSMPSNMFANSQRQMGRQQQVASQDQQQQSQNSQQYPYNQQLQHHLMKQKFQQGTVPQSLMQAQIQQQQQPLLQPGQLQSSQQAVMQPSLRQSSASSTLQQNQQQSLQQSAQSMLQQQQQQSVLRQQQPSVIHQQQTSLPQHSVLPAQQHQPQQLSGQQPNASNMQQNQLIGQQNNALDAQQQHQQQQRIMAQQNNITSLQPPQTINQQNNLPNMHQQLSSGQQNNLQNVHQQQLGSQTNLSGFQQQQMVGIQNGGSSLQPNPQSVHMLQQSKVSVQQQMQQNMANCLPNQAHQTLSQPPQQQLMSQIQSQQGQLQQQLGLQQQVNPLQRDMQQRIQTSGPLLQPHNTIDQQKQLLQSQRIIPEVPLTSLDSSQTGNSNGGDWQEEVYQKIKTMNEMYFPDLNEMYQRMAAKLQQHDSLPQQPKNEQLDKLRFYKLMLERLLMFLQTNKNEVNHSHKEKIVGVEKQIVNVLNSNRPRKPVSSLHQGQIPQPHLPAMQQSQQPQPQISQMHIPENQMNSQMQPINGQNSVTTAQQNNLNNLPHNSLPSVSAISNSRQNMMDTLQPGSNVEPGQGNSLNSIQQVPMSSLQQNLVTGAQQMNINSISSQNGLTAMPSNMNPLQSNSNILQPHQIKPEQQIFPTQQVKQQYQQRQMQQQYMQRQQLIQQQTTQQSTSQLTAQQMMQLNQINDTNDIKMRHQISSKSGVIQQHTSSGQRQSYHHPHMKSGTPFSISSPQVLQGGSPQISLHPSPQLDQQNLQASHVKAGTPLQSANSPFIVPSPSTSMVPSPMPGDSEKINPGVSSLSNAGNIVHNSTAGASGPAQSLAIGTPGISASPLLAEFTSPDGTHGAASTIVSGNNNVVEQPLERLIKVVKSMSQKALSASVSDISSVVSMVDRIAGSAPGNGSRAAVGEDLVAMTKCRLQARNFFTQDGPGGTKKMRRYTSAMPSNVVSSTCSVSDNVRHINGSESDGESTGASSVKRPRIEANHALEEELHEINQRLIDTAVYICEDVDPTAVAAAAEGGGGIIVKCSFSAVALSPNLKSQYASAQMSPIQPLRLLVPNNYPNCSPILLDKFPVEVSKEYEDLSRKAKSRFSISLRTLAQPMSLGEIARTWDICARAVISEYAQQSGGGTFSSKYGTWEDCLSTA